MLKIDRISAWIFIIAFAFLIPGIEYVKFIDELCALLLFGLAVIDSVVNRAWRRYTLLWIIMGIMLFYVVYSLTFVHFNSPRYVMMDFLIEIKPFIPFVVFMALGIRFTPLEKKVLKILVAITATVSGVVILCGMRMIVTVLTHPWIAGLLMFLSAFTYAVISLDDKGRLSRNSLFVIFLILTVGLGCTRSKYYGEYIVAVFFLLVYRPEMAKFTSWKYVMMTFIFIGLIVLAGWNKINYYFVTGNSDSFDPNVMESYARPVLYATGGVLLMDYFPFGSGLASFATYASAINYSTLYYDYGLDKIHGLSPDAPSFITDAFYPSLSQFGIVGVVLFIVFWGYVYLCLHRKVKENPIESRYVYGIGVTLIGFIMIENIGSTTFSQPYGLITMMLLGYLCSPWLEFSGLTDSEQSLKKKIIT